MIVLQSTDNPTNTVGVCSPTSRSRARFDLTPRANGGDGAVHAQPVQRRHNAAAAPSYKIRGRLLEGDFAGVVADAGRSVVAA